MKVNGSSNIYKEDVLERISNIRKMKKKKYTNKIYKVYK